MISMRNNGIKIVMVIRLIIGVLLNNIDYWTMRLNS